MSTINSVSLNTVALSGQSDIYGTSRQYVTYQAQQFEVGLPVPNLGNQDEIPAFIFFGGTVVFGKDAQGNLIAGNPDKPKGAA